MILLGDIACPNIEHAENLRTVFHNNSFFHNKDIVCNLEGLICNEYANESNQPILYNHGSTIDVLKDNGTKIVGLANNHTLDLPLQYQETIETLNKHNIAYSGAGLSKSDANKVGRFSSEESDVFMINGCWDFLLYHQENPSQNLHVTTIDELSILSQVLDLRSNNTDATILVYIHWSFDLETLPFPMHREWSKALIDAGANLVVGCHSHCVQGGEKYNNGFIIYGLGNFYLPNGVFANGNLSFPSMSKMQLALEYEIHTNNAICHWFEYQDDHSVKFLSSEDFSSSKTLAKYSPYAGMNESEYLQYFKLNRRKKRLIPIFSNYRDVKGNAMKVGLLKLRGKVARSLAKLNLISWQN